MQKRADQKLRHRVVIYLADTDHEFLVERARVKRIRRLGEYARMVIEEGLDRVRKSAREPGA